MKTKKSEIIVVILFITLALFLFIYSIRYSTPQKEIYVKMSFVEEDEMFIVKDINVSFEPFDKRCIFDANYWYNNGEGRTLENVDWEIYEETIKCLKEVGK